MKPELNLGDLPRIREALLFALLLSLLGLGLAKSSLDLSKEMRDAHARILGQRREIQVMLARARDEEREIRQKLVRYEELIKRGYVGPEHRLEWVARIREIKERRKLLAVQYEFSPQHAVEHGVAGGYELRSSSMKLQMHLLHEDDLLNFLADLKGSVQAYIRVRSCDVERLSGDRQIAAAQLKAECLIDWITWRELQ